MKIPSLILKQLYTFGSLENLEDGVRFGLKNRLSDASLTRVGHLKLNRENVPLEYQDMIRQYFEREGQ